MTRILAFLLLATPTFAFADEPDDDEPADDEPDPDDKDGKDEDDDDDGDKKSYLGDASSGWFHLGGGLGFGQLAMAGPEELGFEPSQWPIARFTLGGGGYTFGFYGGGQLDISTSSWVPFTLQGLGVLGVHVPTPYVHPMFGFKIGVGLWADDPFYPPLPAMTVGGQMGVIVRQYDGKWGARIMVEPAAKLNFTWEDVVPNFELVITGSVVM